MPSIILAVLYHNYHLSSVQIFVLNLSGQNMCITEHSLSRVTKCGDANTVQHKYW